MPLIHAASTRLQKFTRSKGSRFADRLSDVLGLSLAIVHSYLILTLLVCCSGLSRQFYHRRCFRLDLIWLNASYPVDRVVAAVPTFLPICCAETKNVKNSSVRLFVQVATWCLLERTGMYTLLVANGFYFKISTHTNCLVWLATFLLFCLILEL